MDASLIIKHIIFKGQGELSKAPILTQMSIRRIQRAPHFFFLTEQNSMYQSATPFQNGILSWTQDKKYIKKPVHDAILPAPLIKNKTKQQVNNKQTKQNKIHFVREPALGKKRKKLLKRTAFYIFIFFGNSIQLTNQGKDSLDDALNKFQALKSCPGAQVASALVLSTDILQGVLHWPPQAKKKEKASRERMAFEITHGFLLCNTWG